MIITDDHMIITHCNDVHYHAMTANHTMTANYYHDDHAD